MRHPAQEGIEISGLLDFLRAQRSQGTTD
jgi:hypothetical protein